MKPLHVSSEKLLAFIFEAEPLHPPARRHLDHCPMCQRQFASYQKAARLVPQLYRSQCPSATILSFYCLPGALTHDKQCEVTEHLACCPRCATELAETRQFLEIS